MTRPNIATSNTAPRGIDNLHMVYVQKSRTMLSNLELTSMVNQLSLRVGLLEEFLYNNLNQSDNEGSKTPN